LTNYRKFEFYKNYLGQHLRRQQDGARAVTVTAELMLQAKWGILQTTRRGIITHPAGRRTAPEDINLRLYRLLY
jgi:hypothetical protein